MDCGLTAATVQPATHRLQTCFWTLARFLFSVGLTLVLSLLANWLLPWPVQIHADAQDNYFVKQITRARSRDKKKKSQSRPALVTLLVIILVMFLFKKLVIILVIILVVVILVMKHTPWVTSFREN